MIWIWIVGAVVGLIAQYFVIKYAVIAALSDVDDMRNERAAIRERAARSKSTED